MKYKNLALAVALALALPVAFAETAPAPAPSAVTEAAPAPVPTAETAGMTAPIEVAKDAPKGDELEMFRFVREMDRQDFVKKAMGLSGDQEKKFMDVYFVYNAKLKLLNDQRIAIIKSYAADFDSMTDAKATKLVKSSLAFRKQRADLLAKYFGIVAKATTPIIAARFLQVESVLQGYSDVALGATLPLMSK